MIVVGAGPSGYMCAYELAKKNDKLKILLLDRGRNIYERRCPVLQHQIDKCPMGVNGYRECSPACSITSGFGGAGACSDGNLTSPQNLVDG